MTLHKLNKHLAGGFMYKGNGDWYLIKQLTHEGEDLVFETKSIRYDSVPQKTRQEAYEAHDGGTVIVHPDGLNIDAIAARNGTEENTDE